MNKVINIGLMCFVTFTVSLGGTLKGAGCSLGYPLLMKLFDKYNRETNIKITYKVDENINVFNAILEDGFEFVITDSKLPNGSDQKYIQLPVLASVINIIHNIPSKIQITLDVDLIADIYMMNIEKWNDSKIKRLNPDVDLPDLGIIPLFMSGNSSTFYFTKFMAANINNWEKKIGWGYNPSWFGGMGVENDSDYISSSHMARGGIGFCQQYYTMKNELSVVNVKHSEVISSLVDEKGTAKKVIKEIDANKYNPKEYPIIGKAWIIIKKEQMYNKRSIEAARELLKFTQWLTNSDVVNKEINNMDYINIESKPDKKLLNSLTYNGKLLK